MIQDLEVFMSKHDMESGARWSLQLSKELQDANFGILCLTPDNLQSSWLLFEAGALAKHIDERACGLLLNGLKPTDVAGPLSQFQHRSLQESELKILVKDINKRLPTHLSDEQLGMIFNKWWPDIERDYELAINRIGIDKASGQIRDEREILEEILTKVRTIERSIGISRLTPLSYGVRYILNESLEDLTENQIRLLTEFVTNDRRRIIKTREEIERDYDPPDLFHLIESGLVRKTSDGYVVIHDIIARLLSERLAKGEEIVNDN